MNARSLNMRIREGRSSYISFTAFLMDGHCFFFYLTTDNLNVNLTHDSPSPSYIFQYVYMYICLIFLLFIS